MNEEAEKMSEIDDKYKDKQEKLEVDMRQRIETDMFDEREGMEHLNLRDREDLASRILV